MEEQNRITSLIEQRIKDGLRDQVNAEACAFDTLITAELHRLGISEYETSAFQLGAEVRKLRMSRLVDARLKEIVNGLVASSESKSLWSVDANGRVTPKDGTKIAAGSIKASPIPDPIKSFTIGTVSWDSVSGVLSGVLSPKHAPVDASIARLDAHNME